MEKHNVWKAIIYLQWTKYMYIYTLQNCLIPCVQNVYDFNRYKELNMNYSIKTAQTTSYTDKWVVTGCYTL